MTRYVGPAMTLGNMRQNGVRSILVECACGHKASINVDALPDFVEVPAVCADQPRKRGEEAG